VAAAARPCLSSGTGGSLASAIAYHESGHTVVSRFLGLPLGGATIVATDDYGGLTFAPGADRLNVTRASLREEAQSQCDWAMDLLPPAGCRRDSTSAWLVYAEELAGFSRDLEAQSTDMEIARIYGRTCFRSEVRRVFVARRVMLHDRSDVFRVLLKHFPVSRRLIGDRMGRFVLVPAVWMPAPRRFSSSHSRKAFRKPIREPSAVPRIVAR
jgi:hypothetical protein